MRQQDPVRLLDPGSGAPDLLREALASAAYDEPSEAQLSALATRLAPLMTPPSPVGKAGGPGPASSTAPTPTLTTAASAGVASKVVLATAAVALSVASFQAGRVFERKQTPSPVAAPPTTVAATSPAPPPAATPTTAPPTPEAIPPEPSKPAAPPRPAPHPHAASTPTPVPKPPVAQNLDEELKLLDAAYQAFAKGDAKASLEAAEAHARRFPEGSLAQEREVLALESLVKLGQIHDAERRADAFRAKYPTSTHLVRIRALMERARDGRW